MLKVIPPHEMEVIPPNGESAKLIQSALLSIRQGSGIAGDLAKHFVRNSLALDYEIHTEVLRHQHRKIMMALSEYEQLVRFIEYYEKVGQLDSKLAKITLDYIYKAYNKTLNKSSNFLIGTVVFVGILIVAFQPWNHFTGVRASKDEASQHDSSISLPLKNCQTSDSPSSKKLYPVWVRYDDGVLKHIAENYCPYRFIKNISSQRRVIQVAAFQEQSKASELARMLENDPKVKNGEVGIPTQ
jgi:hypothetical protein